MKHASLALLLAFGLTACSAPQPRSDSRAATAPVTNLNAAFAEFWEEFLQLDPLTATRIGDRRYNDRMPNPFSAEYREQERALHVRWLDRVREVNPASLSEQERLSLEIFRQQRREAIEAASFPQHLIPLNQFYSHALIFAQFGSGTSAQPFATIEDYEAWAKRAAQIPAVFDQAIANMREGLRARVVLPQVLADRMVPQLDALIADDPRETIFWKPIDNFPAAFPIAEQERLASEYEILVADRIIPAYIRLRDFLRDEYVPVARKSPGIDDIPNGAAWYAFLARRMTTTTLTPRQIHDIGLNEVARIQAEMRKVIRDLGFAGDLKAFFHFLNTDPQFVFASEEDLLAQYNGLRARVEAGTAALFSMTPKADFEIRPVEAFRAKSAAGGSYMRPSEDGSRPGIFYVNTYDLPSRKTWDMEDLFLHEAIPGHHFQLALQQELPDLPAFRRFGIQTAYTEGWGLYAESLGREIGIYTDPYMYFGYLQNELWRAIRLVVDTGLHSFGWSRERVIEYMQANSAEGEAYAVAETERYMAIPAQALAYKIGELKIRELRTRAENALGDAFDVRAFHAEVIKDGAVPLGLLERKIDRWIAEQRRH